MFFVLVLSLHNKAQCQSCLKDYVFSSLTEIIYNTYNLQFPYPLISCEFLLMQK